MGLEAGSGRFGKHEKKDVFSKHRLVSEPRGIMTKPSETIGIIPTDQKEKQSCITRGAEISKPEHDG